MSFFVDVHCHLTHKDFEQDVKAVIERSRESGLGALVVNGLEPVSNRKILEWAQEETLIKPSLGIYPVDAVNQILPQDFPIKIEAFDVQAELDFIKRKAEEGSLAAVGECGLDGHWLSEGTFLAQEEVFSFLLDVAKKNDLPVIIHSRKLEKRAFEMVELSGNTKVVFHCYGGKTKLALAYAEKYGWCFSIPAIAHKSQSFSKLLKELPPESLLTETDSPYLAPEKNTRNEPMNVIQTVTLLAKIRAWDLGTAKSKVYSNYQRLFEK